MASLRIFINRSGQALVELLIAIGIAAILIPALATGLIASQEGKVQETERLTAMAYLAEAKEALRIVRDSGWDNVATDGTFHPVISGSTWSLAGGSETLGDLTRSVVISDVYRDGSGNISSSGTIDFSTKKAVISVSWNALFASAVTETLYLTRFTNKSWVQTTKADFDGGVTKTNVTVTNTYGGEVQLAPQNQGHGDWCQPATYLRAILDLPGKGVTTAISAIPGHAYTTTGGNASGDALDSVAITDPAPPAFPVATVANNYNSNKAYAVFAGASNVFIGSDHPGLTVIILDPTALTQVGFFNASGRERPGQSISVAGSTGYVTAGTKLYAFDVGTISGSSSQPELWNVGLSGNGQRVVTLGGYAYVATTSTTNQLQIVNLSTRAVTSFSAGNGLVGIDVNVDSAGKFAYLATAYASGQKNVFIVDVSNAMNPTLVGSYSTSGMNPRGIVTVAANRAIVVGSGGEQYQAIDTSDKTKPVLCGGLTNPNGVTTISAISSVAEADGDVYSYILTDNASQEFQIIEGGGGGGVSNTGLFESSTFDATRSSSFNRFDANAILPSSDTSLTYQVAGAPVGVSGNCSDAAFSFIGPDGTANTFFATGSAIPSSSVGSFQNPARCFRYRAYFSTQNLNQTPIFTDITVNYSP